MFEQGPESQGWKCLGQKPPERWRVSFSYLWSDIPSPSRWAPLLNERAVTRVVAGFRVHKSEPPPLPDSPWPPSCTSCRPACEKQNPRPPPRSSNSNQPPPSSRNPTGGRTPALKRVTVQHIKRIFWCFWSGVAWGTCRQQTHELFEHEAARFIRAISLHNFANVRKRRRRLVYLCAILEKADRAFLFLQRATVFGKQLFGELQVESNVCHGMLWILGHRQTSIS